MHDDTPRTLDDDRALDLVPQPAPIWHAWLETAVLAALATAAAGTDLGLGWLALSPLLAGLRYGSSFGIACAAAQAAALALGWSTVAPGGQVLLAWLVAGLVPGQFRDAWNRRLRLLEARERDARDRLGGLARAYHLLSASHERLRRELPGSPSTLRDALEDFARRATGSGGAGTIESLGGHILELFRAHASVRAATLHPVQHGVTGPAVAALGKLTTGPDDPLVREAARLGEVVSVRDLAEAGETLAAVPLADLSGRVHAVVAVRELPFLSLHQDTLTLFAVLGGQLGDFIARGVSRTAVELAPTRAFCASVGRSLLEARRFGIPAALAAIELLGHPGAPHAPRLLARCLAAHRRVTDEAEIVVGRDGTLRVLVLLKLADAEGLDAYLARAGELARARAQELGSHCHVRLTGWSLDDARLPRRPRDLELGLATFLENAASLPGEPASPGHHVVVA